MAALLHNYNICVTNTCNFYRCNKVGMIGGPKGIEYDAYCRQIENLFYESLDEIKLIHDEILDVTNSSWLENMQTFRNFMMELENMVKNLTDRIFEETKNIEEGIEAIYALQRFKHREALRDILLRKWVQVRKTRIKKYRCKLFMLEYIKSIIINVSASNHIFFKLVRKYFFFRCGKYLVKKLKVVPIL